MGRFKVGPYYPRSAGITALDVSDLNGDGILDIAGVENDSVIIYLGSNITPGTFNVALANSMPIPTGNFSLNPIIYLKDFNNDGLKDVIVSNSTNSIYLYLNVVGNPGTFTLHSSTVVSGGNGIKNFTVSDLNNDGKLDLITSNESTNNISVLLNNGSNVFTLLSHYNVGKSPRGIASQDFNGDGNKDIAVSNILSSNYYIFYGNGTGSLTFSSDNQCAGTPNKLITTDLNSDGKFDITISPGNTGGYFNVFLGNASNNYSLPDIYYYRSCSTRNSCK